MATSSSNGHALSSGGANVMNPPEEVDGFIDLDILVDIHKCLDESKDDDDRALSLWVKSNYLQEPIHETVRPIRDAEGFFNLDKAYRRARQLTGKAQDKWPFLNKYWKKLSTTVIKKVILGETAMGTIRSEINGRGHDTPITNGSDGHHDNHLQTPKSHTSLDSDNLSKYQEQEQNSPRLSGRSSKRQESGLNAHRQDYSPVSKASSTTGSYGVGGTVNSTPLSVEVPRDAGSGKVRGRNGRFVNRDDPSPPAKKKSNSKHIKKTRTRDALEGESEEIPESSDGEVKESRTLSRLKSPASGVDISQDSSEPPVDAKNAVATPMNFPVSAILAAEAEAIPSNLDRMPPGITHKKRKSESDIQRGTLKRARGARGGVLGRPRKSESLAAKPGPDQYEGTKVDKTTSQLPQTKAQPNMTTSALTRRSSKKSAASALESLIPWDPAGDVLFSGASQKQTARNGTVANINGSDGSLDPAKTIEQANVNQKLKSSVKDVLNGHPSTTSVRSSAIQTKTQNTSTPSQPKKLVSFSPETQDRLEKVEFFARIRTTTGTQDVPLLREDLTHEVDLVEAYAKWHAEGNTPISFEVFKNIVLFARPS